MLRFWDFDQQSYQLISDEHNQGVKAGIPWKQGPVPEEFAIYGLGPVEISVSYFADFKGLLENVFGFKAIDQEGNRTLLEVGEGQWGRNRLSRRYHKPTSTTRRRGSASRRLSFSRSPIFSRMARSF